MKLKYLDEKTLLELYDKYHTDVEVGKTLNICRATLWRYKKHFGITRRRLQNRKGMSILNLKEMGYTMKEISERTGHTLYAVREALR